MDFNQYLSPELSVLIPVLYLIGMFIKKSSIKNWLIPFILGISGIVLAFVYLMSISYPTNMQQFFAVLFASVTQGILAAASSVYVNNLYKQFQQRDDDNTGKNEKT